MNGFSELLKGAQGAAPEQQAPKNAAGNPDGQAPEGQGTGQVDGKQASPELQAKYNRFVAMGIMMLWDEKFTPKALAVFKEHPNQTDALASIGAAIAQRIYMKAKEQGDEIPPEVVVHAGWELMNEVAEFATAAGVQGIEPDEIETAYYLAADKVREALEKAGLMDPSVAQSGFEAAKSALGDEGVSAVRSRMQGSQQKTVDALMQRQQQRQPQPEQPGGQQP